MSVKEKKLSADDEKLLRDYADQMPIIMVATHEVHRKTGQDLLDEGYVEWEGNTIDPEKDYEYMAPVQIAMNHYRRLKRAWLKDGEHGVVKYVKEIAAIYTRHKNQNKENA